ncbi:MAG: 3'-5' exonuclease, partial [Bilophila sp.]
MNASSDSEYCQPLSKDEINALPMLSYEGDIVLVQTEGELTRALTLLQNDTVLGFDTESRPSFKKGKSYPTSLIQLAGADIVVLIRLPHAPFTEALTRLLAHPHVVKAGVAIRDDIRSLQRLHPFEPGGLVELADMARHLQIRAQGLRTLTACLMGGRISKA